MKVLNLYAGLGGNRKHWIDCQVTAVEKDPKIAKAYQSQFPADSVIVGDAHAFLKNNFAQFDFIWSSPPCQSHSKMDLANGRNNPRFADLRLYEEILFLQTYAKGKWVVENVVPYYSPLIFPTARIGRHLFWSNFHFRADDIDRPDGFIASGGQAAAESIRDWLGLDCEDRIYYEGNHCPAQVFRNCVHPEIGRQIFEQAKGMEFVSTSNQLEFL